MADAIGLGKHVDRYKQARGVDKAWSGQDKEDFAKVFNPAAKAPSPANSPAPAPVQGLEMSPDAEGPALDREGRMREMTKALKEAYAKRKAQGGM